MRRVAIIVVDLETRDDLTGSNLATAAEDVLARIGKPHDLTSYELTYVGDPRSAFADADKLVDGLAEQWGPETGPGVSLRKSDPPLQPALNPKPKELPVGSMVRISSGARWSGRVGQVATILRGWWDDDGLWYEVKFIGAPTVFGRFGTYSAEEVVQVP